MTAPEVTGDTLVSKSLGLSVTKPPNWRFVSSRELRSAQQSFKSTNRHLNYLSYQSGHTPVVTILRVPRDGLDPTAIITIDRYPLGNDRFASAAKVAGFIVSQYRSLIPGLEVTVPPMPLKIGAGNLAICQIKYPLTFADGTHIECEKQFWIWAFPFTATVVSASCESRDRPVVQTAIDRVVSSIRFER